MYWNRFDIYDAWFIFLSQYHEGQGSERYKKLCKLLTHYNPSLFLKDQDDLNENAREIYDSLVEKEAENYVNFVPVPPKEREPYFYLGE